MRRCEGTTLPAPARRGWVGVCAIALAVGGLFAAYGAPGQNTPVLFATKVEAAPVGPTDPAWAAVQPLQVTLAPNQPEAGGPAAPVALRAVHTGSQLYVLCEWTDPTSTQTVDPSTWQFDVPDGQPLQWSRSGGEDQLVLAWPIGASAGFADQGCASLCHAGPAGQPTMHAAAGERMDIWQWAAGRSDPAQAAHDGWLAADAQPPTPTGFRRDAGVPCFVPNQAPVLAAPRWGFDGVASYDGSGTFLFGENAIALVGDAALGRSAYEGRCAPCHGAKGAGGTAGALQGLFRHKRVKSVVQYLIAAEANHTQYLADPLNEGILNNTLTYIQALTPIPGYLVGTPQGSCGDITASSRFNQPQAGGWSVMLTRALSTGNEDDVALRPGDAQVFAVAVMDGAAANHAVSTPVALVMQ